MSRAYRKIHPGMFKLHGDWDPLITPQELEPLTRAKYGEAIFMGNEVQAMAFENGGIVWLEDCLCSPTGRDRTGVQVIWAWALYQFTTLVNGFPRPRSRARQELALSPKERARLYACCAMSDDWRARPSTRMDESWMERGWNCGDSWHT
jgi:hypothetical protein